MDDRRSEANAALKNNTKILGLLSESIEIAEGNTALLDKGFGLHQLNTPRIGTALIANCLLCRFGLGSTVRGIPNSCPESSHLEL